MIDAIDVTRADIDRELALAGVIVERCRREIGILKRQDAATDPRHAASILRVNRELLSALIRVQWVLSFGRCAWRYSDRYWETSCGSRDGSPKIVSLPAVCPRCGLMVKEEQR